MKKFEEADFRISEADFSGSLSSGCEEALASLLVGTAELHVNSVMKWGGRNGAAGCVYQSDSTPARGWEGNRLYTGVETYDSLAEFISVFGVAGKEWQAAYKITPHRSLEDKTDAARQSWPAQKPKSFHSPFLDPRGLGHASITGRRSPPLIRRP